MIIIILSDKENGSGQNLGYVLCVILCRLFYNTNEKPTVRWTDLLATKVKK